MNPDAVIWVSGFMVGLTFAMPIGIWLGSLGIPRLVDAVYAWAHRDRT